MKQRIAIGLTLLLLTGLNSCKKSDVQENQSVQNSAMYGLNEKITSSDDYQAFTQKVNTEYEFYGDWVYDHLKSKTGLIKPEEYISSVWRSQYVDALESYKSSGNGKSLNTLCREAVTEGILLENQVSVFTGYIYRLQNEMQNGRIQTYSAIWNYLRQQEKILENDTSLKLEDKIITLVFSSIVRNTFKYQYEKLVLAPQMADQEPVAYRDGGSDCILGITYDCWLQTLAKSVIDGIKAGVVAGIANQGGGIIDAAFWKAFKNAGLLGLVTNLLTTLANPGCFCSDGTEAPACSAPTGINIFIPDCSNTVIARAVISGINPNTTSWTLINGRAVDFNIDNPSYLTIVGTSLRVEPIDPAQPLIIAVANNCPGGSPFGFGPMSYNIPTMVADPGTIIISGPTISSVGQTNRYTFSGTSLTSFNANNLLTKGCSYHGSVVNTGTDFIDVHWTISSSTGNPYGGATSSVSGYSRNSCSGQYSTGYYPVYINP